MRVIHEKSDQTHLTVKDRLAAGKKLRDKVPRSSHSRWTPRKNRPDPIELLKESDRGRLPALLPIRYARMRESPFAFFRGAAALMAADLASTPVTGIRVQACGDCHVANFGGFGTPERHLVFDINDFDETLPAPWEWDVKRLAASIVLAMRQASMGERHCSDAARTSVESYRKHMREYAEMTALEVWYSQLNAELFVQDAETPEARKRWRRRGGQGHAEYVRTRIPENHGDAAWPSSNHRLSSSYLPLPEYDGNRETCASNVSSVSRTLPEERRIVLDRYELVDIARKVVGVGSVGTRCAVALLMAGPHDPLFLQFKEARASVLEALCWQEQVFESRGASRHRPANASVGQRRISWLDERRPRP